jgi:hypothetical protein
MNGVASSKIVLSNVCFRNGLSSLVQPYEVLQITKITDTTPLKSSINSQQLHQLTSRIAQISEIIYKKNTARISFSAFI